MTFLLIVHGLLAVALLGALTHQALAVCFPSRKPETFLARFRAVSSPSYTTAVIVLFLITFVIGSVIYPAYRLNVRTYLQDYRMYWAEGIFEIKEHVLAISLALLPFYAYLWRRPAAQSVGAATAVADADEDTASAFIRARAAVTVMIALAVWFSFLTGHVLNNIRGLFGT
jgi:hypothetical protein